jgi:membrane associated rhomboid family serine protease
MVHGSRICPHCGRLNAAEDAVCHRCGKRLAGPLLGGAASWFAGFSQDGLPATKILAGICIAVFGLSMASDVGLAAGGLPGLGGFSPSTLLRFGALIGPPLIEREPWRVLSAVFVHGSILHIGMNLLSLVNLGRTIEPHFRSARFVLLYLLSGTLGFCATLYWRGEQSFSVGASGAIFGLLGAFIAALMIRRNPGWQRVFFSNLIFAFVLAFAAGSGGQQIDNAAHVGGFVSGFLLGLVLEIERKPRQRDAVFAVFAVIGLALVFVSLALSARSPVWKAERAVELERR